MKANWEELKNKYVTSDITYKDLAKESGVTYSAIEKRARAEKWKDERRKHYDNVAKKIQEGVADELAKAYQEVVSIAKKELIEEAKLLVEIRKNIKPEDQYAESRVNKCSLTIKDILNTLEHHAYPQRDEKSDNNAVFVVGQDVKELFK